MPIEPHKNQKPSLVRPSARAEAYRAFLLGLVDELRERHHFTGVRTVQPRHYCNFATGTSWTHYSASFAKRHEVRTEVCLRLSNQQANKALFHALAKDKTAIEREFGEPLRWERLDGGSWSRIAAYRPGSIEDDRTTLRETRAWMIDRLLRFKKVFGPRLKQLVR
jgi:hypothetical protein